MLLVMNIVQQLTIGVSNHPGSLAHVSDTLRRSGVNIDAVSCTEGKHETLLHVVVDDPVIGKMALTTLGNVTETPIIAYRVKNKPGAIADLARKCAGAQISILKIYATSLGKEAMCYLEVDDLSKASKALKK